MTERSAMIPGIEKAWDILEAADPSEVCRRAAVGFDPADRKYMLKSFGMDITMSVTERRMSSSDPKADVLLKRLSYFSGLSYLWYLVSAQDIPLSGRLINPGNLKGGDIFFRGTHVLPLDQLAGRYGMDLEAFEKKALELGGQPQQYGDRAHMLRPLPRIPVVLIMWREDDEFPARADLLFDASCESQAPLDILWSVAMMSILICM